MKHWRTAQPYPATFMPHCPFRAEGGEETTSGDHFWVSWASKALALPTMGTGRGPQAERTGRAPSGWQL